MANIENVTVTDSEGAARAAMVGMGSNQTPATTQTASRNPRRMAPASDHSDSTGRAELDPQATLSDQSSNYSASDKTTNAMRKRIWG